MTTQPLNILREGTISWYGGFNRQKNKNNDYGFLSDNEVGGVFFHSSQLQQDDLLFLEKISDQGKGIIVNYKINYNAKKEKYQVTEIKLKKVIALKTVLLSSNKLSKLAECVLRFKNDQINREIIRFLEPSLPEERKIIYQALDELSILEFSKIIHYFIESNSSQYISELLENFLSIPKNILAQDSVLNEIFLTNPTLIEQFSLYIERLDYKSLKVIASNQNKLDISPQTRNLILSSLIHNNQYNGCLLAGVNRVFLLSLAQYSSYWEKLSSEDLISVYLHNKEIINQKYLSIFTLCVLKALKERIFSIDNRVWTTIEGIKDYVEYHGQLWDVAPISVKNYVIHKKYKTYFDILEKWQKYSPPYHHTISIPIDQIPDFTDDDEQLVSKWVKDSPGNNRDFIQETMSSARRAEKAAIHHYEQRTYNVWDSAIGQVFDLSDSWRLYDLEVRYNKNIKYVDVKNARSNYTKTNRFSEFCVPRFKVNQGNNIVILGVFSPYIERDGQHITILGEVTEPLLRNLQTLSQQIFPQLTITVKKSSSLKTTHLSEYIPPWAFDFDENFYQERLDIEHQYRSLDREMIPSLSDLQLLGLYPFSLALSAAKRFPSHWYLDLTSTEIRFAEILMNLVGEEDSTMLLSHIFLTVLLHFLENCLNPDPTFSPNMYKKILFSSTFQTMGVCDPLRFMENMCTIIETLWERCREVIHNFNYFKFDSRGLLQGRNKTTGVYQTILAYCGGWIKRNGRIIAACGNEPLYMGYHQTCPRCHKLICERCRFCFCT